MHTSRAWAEIDLDALAQNLRTVRRRVGAGVAVLLVAKADAYGHGAVAVAHQALRCGVEAIGVSNCAEALELRRAGVGARLVVLGAVFGDEAVQALELGVELGIPSAELCASLERVCERVGLRARVHLKVDTGMNRLGVTPEEALALLERIRRSASLELAGVMTHVAATVGARDETTAAQVLRFQEVLERARSAGLLAGRDLWIHVANSACLLTDLDPLFDAVRPGIAVYGVSPDPAIEAPELRPVMSVRTRIVQVKEVATGARIGYGGTWEARRPSRIATLPVGYDDGVDWRLGNRGHVLLRGRRAPIVGGISMDYTTIDVTEVPVPRLGEPVTLIGSDGAERIRVEELAQEIGTIPYDVTCSIGKRVQRVYLGGTESPSAESA